MGGLWGGGGGGGGGGGRGGGVGGTAVTDQLSDAGQTAAAGQQRQVHYLHL